MIYVWLGVAGIIGVLSFLLWAANVDLDAKNAQISSLSIRLRDAGSKIEQQNKAVDAYAQAAELAKHERDEALAAVKPQVIVYEKRAQEIRDLPPPKPEERTAAKAVAEIRARLKP